MNMNTLAVTAHPDDAETMLGYALMHTQGRGIGRLSVLVATDGTRSTVNHRCDWRFVGAGERRLESRAGLAYLGVRAGDQMYAALQDGELSAQQDELAECVVKTVIERKVSTVITLGEYGYDGAHDHIATHLAVEQAVKTLSQQYDRSVGMLALSSDHTGEVRMPATREGLRLKLGAMSCHASQFVISPGLGRGEFAVDPSTWERLEPYHPLILDGETYISS
jgi:LmbE family N-acetylglucosaminyl deacetylase